MTERVDDNCCITPAQVRQDIGLQGTNSPRSCKNVSSMLTLGYRWNQQTALRHGAI